MSSTDPNPDGNGDTLGRELDVLLSDYQATREDDRQALARDVAVISAGVAVFAAFYYLAAGERSFLVQHPLLAAALPLAPYLVAQAYVVNAIESVLRSYYIRAL